MRTRREDLAREIRGLADRCATWTTADESRWAELNAEYDAEYAREVVQAQGGNRRLIGRDGASLLGTPPAHGGMFGNAPDDATALAAWLRNGSGLPVPANEFDAAVRYGIDPRAGAFDLRFQTGSPTVGLTIQPRAAQGVTGGAAGGYTVPSETLARLEAAMKAFGPMLQTSEVWITSDGRETAWPTCDDTDNSGSQVGEDTDVGAAADLEFGATMFRNYKATSGVLRASHELLRDSAINLTNAIMDKLGERIGRFVNTRLTLGSGANTAHGIVNGATVGKTAASATAIAFDELVDLMHSVDPAYRGMPGVGWMMNDSTAAHVSKLKDGNGDYLWRQSTVAGQPSTLLGYPVWINQDMASIATGAIPILFGQLTAYKARIVSGTRMRTLVERYAEFDQTGFIGFLEFDGHLLKPSATASLCPVRSLQMA